ncbi:glycosyltransferase [Cyanobium gracile UHCC 0139]|uniref:Glycosyltransferase n=1 Tax=Cyanobium gracile UHCC 0139 TaxID=3110308 RepID=A0ABU5RWX6_9CYAN|nr:glycosyltransferase [Cyanobium gracile]MEA5392296.1 glycosyltransferase [Cyanobium gracile UHCC 0139]
MELLLIHQNHPGQFRDLTPALEHRGHRVLGLGATPRGQRLDYGWQPPALPEGLADPLLETSLRRAARVQERCLQLRDQGYRPAAVLAHSGWGELLYLRDIWPEAVLIAYPELYAAPLLLGYGFDADLGDPSPALRAQWRRGNLMGLAAVADADACVVPTRFARDTFPPHLRSRFHVLHEGIALPAAAGGSTSLRLEGGPTLVRGDPVITFASRNLEPLRGFRSVMRALPAVLAARPDARAVIVGGTGSGYGAPSSHPEGHKGELLALLGHRLPLERVHFLPPLAHRDLLALFRISAAHVHFSYPYALSWSLLEAMASGALVVGSANPPLDEVIQHGHNGLLVPFNDPDRLADTLLSVLADPPAYAAMAAAGRATVAARYGVSRAAEAFEALILSLQLLR